MRANATGIGNFIMLKVKVSNRSAKSQKVVQEMLQATKDY
jgi:hypothetical protein